MATYLTLLHQAEKKARTKGLESSGVKMLLLHFSNLSASHLYGSLHQECPKEVEISFLEGLHRYFELLEPVQYIIGYVYFYGYRFKVGPNVLIPRFETEELVANVLLHYDELFPNQEVSLIDIGTGSGCLAIALKLEEPRLQVEASDISHEALETARANAEALQADVVFHQGDLCAPFFGRTFDISVSNPPYIPNAEVVEDIILKNEPHLALFGGEDGLTFYRQILTQAKSLMKPTFLIAFEHAYDKANEIQALAKAAFPNASVETMKDLQGKDRMTFIKQVSQSS